MDVNLRKTATDTAYIVVGVGVLGFQQAQVRRRDAIARAATIRRDARGTLKQQTDKIKTRTEGCAANIAGLGSTLGSNVGGTVGGTVSNTVDALGTQVKAGVDLVGTQVKAGADAVGTQVKAGADLMGAADPRTFLDPVVGDIRVRVEPVVEQLRTITLPGTVSALPDQVSKVIEVGRNRVQGRFGGGSEGTIPAQTAATGRS
jgi:hypothetical protein